MTPWNDGWKDVHIGSYKTILGQSFLSSEEAVENDGLCTDTTVRFARVCVFWFCPLIYL